MCIVCNCDDPSRPYGSDFLTSFSESQKAMKEAADSMLKCSKEAFTEDDRKKYDRTYKHMVRVMRDWNRTEEIREAKI